MKAPTGQRIASGRNTWQGGRLVTRPAWSWRTTNDPGLLQLWHDDEAVGMLSLLSGHVEHRAVLMDLIVEHLNHPD